MVLRLEERMYCIVRSKVLWYDTGYIQCIQVGPAIASTTGISTLAESAPKFASRNPGVDPLFGPAYRWPY